VRRLFSILRGGLTLLSLPLLIICFIVGVRSFFVADEIIHGRNGYAADGTLIRNLQTVRSSRGDLQISVGHISSIMFRAISPREEGWHHLAHEPGNAYNSSWVVWSHMGFTYGRIDNAMLGARIVIVPFWFLNLLFCLLPALWIIRRLRRKPIEPNRCPTCGYDLRATPDRCPECGAVPAALQTR